MKKVLMILFVMLLLAGLTAPQVTAYSKHGIYQNDIYQEQRKELTKDLGDGFEGKIRETDGAVIVMVKFPAKYSVNAEAFIAGVQIGLGKILSCDALVCENGKPKIGITDGEKPIVYVQTKAGALPLLFMLDENDNLIGFAVAIPKPSEPTRVMPKIGQWATK